MRYTTTLILALVCAVTPAHAVSLTAFTQVSIPSPDFDGDASDSQQSDDPAAVLNSSSSAVGDFNDGEEFTTVTTASAEAKASATNLGVGGSILVEGYQQGFSDEGCCMNVAAGAFFTETFSVTNDTELDAIFASPIWYVEGSLQGDNILSSTVRLFQQGFSSETGFISGTLFLLESESDGSVQSAAQTVDTLAFGVGADGFLEISTRLSLEIFGEYPSSLAFGNTFLGSADFMNTATFGGFEVFADEEMTTQILSGVTITSADGQIDYPVVPIPAAAWLFMSAVGVLGWFGRRSMTR